MTTKIYGILEKATNTFVGYNNRGAWTKAGNAKNAWVNANNFSGKEFVGFDEQGEYEVVELTEVYYMYEGLCK